MCASGKGGDGAVGSGQGEGNGVGMDALGSLPPGMNCEKRTVNRFIFLGLEHRS